MFSFSIVVNTLNRAELLGRTLKSFSQLQYAGAFEVIVVNGPSTDDTVEVMRSFDMKIRTASCVEANLSISRNIGICMAQGDIVAFIDDDAIPEPEWLTQLAAAYDRAEIGAAGGVVYDHTGVNFQYQYSTADRLGNSAWNLASSAEHLCFPYSSEFPYVQGTNASYRRSALLEIGGFDEEIEYYLDETDVCCRLIDAGYVVRQLPDAFVHHKFAPSNIRDENKIGRHRYPVIKNKVYFSLKHARRFAAVDEILDDGKKFIDMHRRDVELHVAGGRLVFDEIARFEEQAARAYDRALAFVEPQPPKGIDADKLNRWAGTFLHFQAGARADSRSVVIVSRDYPPSHAGGIATYAKNLAEALAERGEIVHVIAQTPDINRVDLEDGVWVHRIKIQPTPMPQAAQELETPTHIWNWSVSALKECRRIAKHRKIDIVEAPVWDCEGVAFLLDGDWPLVTSLHTPLRSWIASHPVYGEDSKWMASFGRPMLELEIKLMTASDAIRANSLAISREIEKLYGFVFDKERLVTIHHGLCEARVAVPPAKTSDGIDVLFVGRLERRKGIDVLLTALPFVLEACDDLKVTIVGDNTLIAETGDTFMNGFLAEHHASPWFSRVAFLGKASDEALQQAYANCDIFVAPSRFESFGLVFLEAMRVGKPVIGCSVGGMPEIIVDGETGRLVPPGDAEALAEALRWMVEHPEARAAMGAAGRRRFETYFTAVKMAERSDELFDIAVRKHKA